MRERREIVPSSLEELSKEENQEKEDLLDTGFNEWSKNDFAAFLRGCEKFGRNSFERISNYMETKTEEEIRAYAEVFWKRYTELPEYDKTIKNIERGEEIIRQKQISIELIEEKCKGKKYYDEIEFNHHIYSKFRSRFYSTDHDKYLVFASFKWGYGNWREVRLGIKKEDSFEFDHYFKSRTESELNKRMASLLRVIKAELDDERKREYYRKVDAGDIIEGEEEGQNGRSKAIPEVEEVNFAIVEDEERDADASGDKANSKKPKISSIKPQPTKPKDPVLKKQALTSLKAKENSNPISITEDDEKSSSLKKRLPEKQQQNGVKQQTLGSFFGLGLENMKPTSSPAQS